MLIQKKRIQNPEKYLELIPKNENFIVGVRDISRFNNKLEIIGLYKKNIGDSILPPDNFGSISRFNTHGKYIILKDKEKENRFIRTIVWHWKQFNGRHNFIDCEERKDIYKKCYQRKYVYPPSIELTICKLKNEKRCICSSKIKKSNENIDLIKNTINLFLEIFGEAEIFTSELDTILPPQIKRLNWEILPQGNIPWDKLEKHFYNLKQKNSSSKQKFFDLRLKHLHNNNPIFTAVGKSGFDGYVIFGFENKNIYILESGYYGNATYILGKDWENISKLTKKDILNQELQIERIIHDKFWFSNINKYIN